MAKYTHERMIRIYDKFVEKTHLGHREAATRRDYVNNIQWTEDERATLEQRKQPIITDNRIKRKTDYFLGIERQPRSDPKAYPRTPEHEDASEAFTDAIRYVCDNSDWDIERSEGFDNLIVEGIEGYSVYVENTPEGIQIKISHIPWERLIYDEHSRDRFFRDSHRKGVATWMDFDDALNMFPKKKKVLEESINSDMEDSVFDDKPDRAIWADQERKRVKVIQMYYLDKGVWNHCIFCRGGFLLDPQESTYLDEYGRPDCPIELAGAYIDKDNDRFGLVQDMMSLQDMVNKATSKYMHLINQNQTWGNQRGPDANKAKEESRKPDGHFELKGDAKLGEDFGIIPTDSAAIGTFNILQNAITSLSEIGGNQIVDEGASGRSKEVTAQTKMIELGPVLDTHRQCSKRVYRQVWNRIKQFKQNEEWWIRVTDDENKLKFVMLNQPMTFRMALEEKYGKIPPEAENHPNIDQVMTDEAGNPKMIRNDVAALDVDIIVEESPDIINIQQEQFAVVAKLAEARPEEVTFEKLVRLSQLRGKEEFLEDTKGSEQEQMQAAQQAQQKQAEAEKLAKLDALLSMKEKEAEIMSKKAKAVKDLSDADAQKIENNIVRLELGITNAQ